METLNVSLDSFKTAFPETSKVYAVTSTQWIDDSSKRVVDLYAAKSNYLLQCTVSEGQLNGYVLLNNVEMGDGATQDAISNASTVAA